MLDRSKFIELPAESTKNNEWGGLLQLETKNCLQFFFANNPHQTIKLGDKLPSSSRGSDSRLPVVVRIVNLQPGLRPTGPDQPKQDRTRSGLWSLVGWSCSVSLTRLQNALYRLQNVSRQLLSGLWSCSVFGPVKTVLTVSPVNNNRTPECLQNASRTSRDGFNGQLVILYGQPFKTAWRRSGVLGGAHYLFWRCVLSELAARFRA